jgi:hypothetical protein
MTLHETGHSIAATDFLSSITVPVYVAISHNPGLFSSVIGLKEGQAE